MTGSSNFFLLCLDLAVYYRNSPGVVAYGAASDSESFDDGRMLSPSPRAKNNHNPHNNEPNKVKVRKYFPETWLWESATAG